MPRPRLHLSSLVLLAASLSLSGCGRDSDAASKASAAHGASADSAAKQSAQQHAGKAGPRVGRPDSLRALYVNGWAAGSRSRMAELVRIADSTEINAFVVDVKESDTYLAYEHTAIPLAKEIGADQRPASKWLPALVDTLRAHHIYPIARIVVFKDRMLAEKRPDMAIRHVNGGIWHDQKGKPWVNPYDRRVWDYNIAIAKEALEMGFEEVQWDYVRFPDVVPSLAATMTSPGANGKSKADNIRDFLAYSRQQLAPYRVPVTADVFGLSTHMEGDVGIGQNWEHVIANTDAVQPMVYPSHYYPGMYAFQEPNQHPYQMVRMAMEDAAIRTRWVRESGQHVGEVAPWLQAFSAPWIDDYAYGPAQVRDQIQAVYDAGLKSWILWQPGSHFDPYLAALRPANGGPSQIERSGWKPPQWPVPHGRLSKYILKREAAARGQSVDSAGAAATPAAAGRPAAGQPVTTRQPD